MSRRGVFWVAFFVASGVACQPSEPKAPMVNVEASTSQPQGAAPVAPEPAPDPNAWRREVPTSIEKHLANYPTTERRYTKSGLASYSVTRESSTQSLSIACKAGASYDPVGRSGTSGLVARMLTEGTERLDGDALAVATERLGTELRASNGDELLTVQIEVLPESANAALELLSQVVRRPGFRSKDFERVRLEWLDDLKSQREEPSTLAELVARRALLGRDAGQNPLGTPGEVAKLAVSDLRAFHQATIVPSRCAVLSVGPLSTAALEGLVNKHFGSWKVAPSTVERRTPQWSPHSRVLFVNRAGAVQTSLFLASATPSRKVPGFEARQVVNSYFGGIFTSRLTTNLREKHAFTYGAYSILDTNSQLGVWSIGTDVKSDVTLQAVAQVALERQKLVDGSAPGREEVERAKAALIERNNARLEHTNLLLSALQAEFANELASDYFATAGSVIERLSPADLMQQLPHFSPPVSVLVLVGPREALKDTSGLFNAPIQIVDVSWLDSDLP